MTINMNLDYKVAFLPENFLFGVAYAPYLSEGGYNYPDGIKNNLATLELTGKTEKSKQASWGGGPGDQSICHHQ